MSGPNVALLAIQIHFVSPLLWRSDRILPPNHCHMPNDLTGIYAFETGISPMRSTEKRAKSGISNRLLFTQLCTSSNFVLPRLSVAKRANLSFPFFLHLFPQRREREREDIPFESREEGQKGHRNVKRRIQSCVLERYEGCWSILSSRFWKARPCSSRNSFCRLLTSFCLFP